jgi:hypothetical protein
MKTLARTFAGPTVIGGLALLAAVWLWSPAGPESSAQPPADRDARTVKGTVQRFTTAPMGEVDGAVLEDGTVIHWPPHAGSKIADLIAKKDRVRMTGRTETGPDGDSHFEVQTITNVRTGDTVNVADLAPPPPPGPGGRPGRPAPPPLPPDRRRAAPDQGADQEQRLRALEEQVEQLRKEVERLRREK